MTALHSYLLAAALFSFAVAFAGVAYGVGRASLVFAPWLVAWTSDLRRRHLLDDAAHAAAAAMRIVESDLRSSAQMHPAVADSTVGNKLIDTERQRLRAEAVRLMRQMLGSASIAAISSVFDLDATELQLWCEARIVDAVARSKTRR